MILPRYSQPKRKDVVKKMIEIKNYSVMNLVNAMRGARNPLNSWDKSDSYTDQNGDYHLGEADLKLASKLCRAGSDHRKFIRQIFVSVDLLAPLYWWKEFDTYKVGTVANSTSTMHKIHSKPFDMGDFSCDKMDDPTLKFMRVVVSYLEELRLNYNATKDKEIWYSIIQLLPSSYNQLRTVTLNYETLINIYNARKNHKLAEWQYFCAWVETLPYANELILMKD